MKTIIARICRPIELLVVISVLWLAYCRDIEGVTFHGDESQWIATSSYFEALVDRDFVPPDWLTYDQLDKDLVFSDWVEAGLTPSSPPDGVWEVRYWTLTQPPMVRYIIAIGRLAGGYHVADLNAPWDFSVGFPRNIALGTVPSPGLLWWSRAIMAVLAVISGLVLFLLVRGCSGAIAGYLFVFLYVDSSYLLLHLRRAMGESTLLFFTSLTLLAAALAMVSWHKIRDVDTANLSPRKRLIPLIGLAAVGLGAGLAGSAKLNGLALVLVGVILCFLIAFGRGGFSHLPGKFATALWTSVGVVLIATAVFVALNPFLYPNPPARTGAMITLRNWEMTNNQLNPQWGIPDMEARLEVVPRRLFEEYVVLPTGLLNIPLFGLGLFFLLYRAWQWLRGKGGSPISIAILAVAAVTAFPPLLTPLDWDRYYLYPVIFISVCIAIGIGESLHALYRRFREAWF